MDDPTDADDRGPRALPDWVHVDENSGELTVNPPGHQTGRVLALAIPAGSILLALIVAVLLWTQPDRTGSQTAVAIGLPLVFIVGNAVLVPLLLRRQRTWRLAPDGIHTVLGTGRTRSVPWHAVDTIRLVSTMSGGGPYQFRFHGWQFRDASGEPRADVSVTIGDRAEAVAGLEAILDHCRDAGWVPASARIERDVPQA